MPHKQRLEKFESVVSGISGGATMIIAQLDPDALAATITLREIIRSRKSGNGFRTRIFFGGAIGHPQNKAIVNKFDLAAQLRPIKEFSAEHNQNVVLVDSSVANDGRLALPAGLSIDPVIVIDHHRGGNIQESEKKFVWIEDIGAVSTMAVELAKMAGFEFSPDQPMLPLLLATGIYTDTGGLIDCSSRDREAFNYVTSIVGGADLVGLFRYPLPASHFENVKRALSQMEIQGGKLVTNLGVVRPDEGDDLATISDYLIRMQGITLVVVWAIIDTPEKDKRMVRISARNADITSDLGAFLRETFPEGSSGAKVSAYGQGIGGGTVNLGLGFWLTRDTAEQAVALVGKLIHTRIFSRL
ncbi:MAG: hypothetical protein UW71_C0020G0011 [Parcubacteria group bacterium GW2011_GWB1_44_7]|nr:MAG: hypothetical protein UW71_C0020G0011 [Parcubacteria group bacterium GW2011_GWB1_44_7]